MGPNIVPRESHNLSLVRRPYLHFPLKEALPQRDWLQSPGRPCSQSGTRHLSAIFRRRSPAVFCANAIAERELPVPI